MYIYLKPHSQVFNNRVLVVGICCILFLYDIMLLCKYKVVYSTFVNKLYLYGMF